MAVVGHPNQHRHHDREDNVSPNGDDAGEKTEAKLEDEEVGDRNNEYVNAHAVAHAAWEEHSKNLEVDSEEEVHENHTLVEEEEGL